MSQHSEADDHDQWGLCIPCTSQCIFRRGTSTASTTKTKSITHAVYPKPQRELLPVPEHHSPQRTLLRRLDSRRTGLFLCWRTWFTVEERGIRVEWAFSGYVDAHSGDLVLRGGLLKSSWQVMVCAYLTPDGILPRQDAGTQIVVLVLRGGRVVGNHGCPCGSQVATRICVMVLWRSGDG